jgi:hypothetical protein
MSSFVIENKNQKLKQNKTNIFSSLVGGQFDNNVHFPIIPIYKLRNKPHFLERADPFALLGHLPLRPATTAITTLPKHTLHRVFCVLFYFSFLFLFC